MKVLYDHQIFEAQEYGGISKYFSELIRSNPLASLALEFSDNAYIREDERYTVDLRKKDYYLDRFLGGLRFKGKSRLFSYYQQYTGRRRQCNKDASIEALKAADFEVFHPTYYDPYFLERIGERPFVLTIYDMIHEKYPEMFNMDDVTGENKKRIALEAGLIIAISENTKRDIVAAYGIDPGRVRVVYLGSRLPKLSVPDLGLPRDYILFTGTRERYKNFVFFVHTVAELLLDRPGLHLVCAGPDFSRDELALFARLGIAGKVLHRGVPESALYSLYKNARCFVFPSYYEGFGIPVLEAFESGCPALLARSSCLPEIGGEAALYFDPKDRRELLEALGEALDHETLCKELAAKGAERLKEFSWDRTYAQTLECYRGVL
jgi:glycosyltransferase involved in cell wall biosynthesis